jgi:hypothetical protein
MRYVLVLFLLLSAAVSQVMLPTLEIANREILKNNEETRVFTEGKLNDDYNAETFDETLSCRNGNLVTI